MSGKGVVKRLIFLKGKKKSASAVKIVQPACN